MSNSEKLESMLEFLCNDVYEVFSANLDMVRQLVDRGRLPDLCHDLIEFAISDQGAQLKSIIEASAVSDVVRVIRQSLLADGIIDNEELAIGAEILQKSLHRYCWLEGYQQFRYARKADELQDFLIQWEEDPSLLGGATLDGALLNPLAKLVCLACIIDGSIQLFRTYSQVLKLTAKLILDQCGVTNDERNYFADLKDLLSELEASISSDLASAAEGSTNQNQTKQSKPITESSQLKPEDALQQGLDELNALIGLNAVKREVKRLTNFLKIRQQRLDQGLPVASQTLHFVFTGNPGTGKTTVARIIAKILYGFQILKTAKFIEADRATMVGGYVGQTAIKSNEVISQATDGVLFIDEAYSLSKSGGQDYGQEAIETLLKKMEDLRDRLVVIVAGYPNEMAEFISSNPGLESRFSRYIIFDDYHVSDLCQIFELMCRSNSYQLTPEARGNLAILLNRIFRDRDQNFGNARLVRNAYERTLGNHADRLANSDGEITRETLSTIEAVDLPFKIADGISEPYDLTNSVWHVNCPQCENSTSASLPFLGQIVKCNSCSTRIRCPWWNLDRNTVPGLVGFEIYERAVDLDGYDVQPEKAEADVNSLEAA